LKEVFSNILVLAVILLAILSVILFRRNVDKKNQQYLLAYLCGNFTFELIVLVFIDKGFSTYGVYNLEMIFEVLFFLFFFYRNGAPELIKNSIPLLISIFVLFSIYNILLIQKWTDFNTNTYTLGSFFLFYVCGYYLIYSVLRNENKNPLRNLLFWISLGLLFCYLGNFPFLSNVNQLFTLNAVMATSLRTISLVVNLLLYLLIIVGVICNRTT
jgi:hypothetical protein